MRITRALLSALALLALLAVPAFAQSGTVTVSLDCYTEPEGLTVENGLDVALTVTGITSLEDNDGDSERVLDVEVAAGESATIEIGAESASGSDNIFDNERDEAAYVYITVAGQEYTPQRTCSGEASFTLGDDQDDNQDDDEDDQQIGAGDDQQAMVTKTFELTLIGDVPAGESFSVGHFSELEYNEGEGNLLLFCSDSEDASIPEDVEACEGNGTVYRLSVELPQGDTLRTTFYRGFGPGPNTEAFYEETEVVDEDMTNTAWYGFGGQDDNQQDDQDDQQGEMPEELPETGVGGLAAGATIPAGGLFATLTMLIGAGYIALRRR